MYAFGDAGCEASDWVEKSSIHSQSPQEHTYQSTTGQNHWRYYNNGGTPDRRRGRRLEANFGGGGGGGSGGDGSANPRPHGPPVSISRVKAADPMAPLPTTGNRICRPRHVAENCA